MNFGELKSGGFIKQTQENLFAVRLRCPGGKLTSQQLRKAAELAEKYGQGEVHNSFRQSVEIPYVHYQHFNAVVNKWKNTSKCGGEYGIHTQVLKVTIKNSR
jgi:dissimilatory sulfite reductase (desulfoviridin) alpha/beta subunit|tara:strand:+ start:173 stop:478 length:306 start_codon:yes stop_codon:yes gene_type:complete